MLSALTLLFVLTGAPVVEAAAPLSVLIREALERNPELEAARRRVEASRARVPQAGALPDPMAMYGVMNEGRPVPFETLGEAGFSEVYVGLSQDLPFPGKRRLREAVAREAVTAEEWALEGVRRRVAAEVAEAWFELYAARAALDVLEQSRVVLDQMTAVAGSRFSVGQGIQQDVFDAEVELSALEERRAVLLQQRQALEARLAALLNQRAPVVVAIAGGNGTGPDAKPLEAAAEPDRAAPVELTPMPGPLPELVARAEQVSPMVRERQGLALQGERKADLARRERLPDLGLQFVYHNRGGLDPYYTFGGTVTLPVWAGRKQKKVVEEAAAELSGARSSLEAARNQVRYEVREAWLAAAAADRVLRLYDEALLKQAELSLESAIAQYRVGRVDFQTLVTAWRRLLEGRSSRYEQVARREKALARLAMHVPPEGGPLAVLREH